MNEIQSEPAPEKRTFSIDFSVSLQVDETDGAVERCVREILERALAMITESRLSESPPPATPDDPPSKRDRKRGRCKGELTLRGVTFKHDTFAHGIQIVLRELANDDPSFLPKLYDDKRNVGRTNRLIGEIASELYPTNPPSQPVLPLPGGWLLAEHGLYSNPDGRIFPMIEDHSSVELGVDLVAPELGIEATPPAL